MIRLQKTCAILLCIALGVAGCSTASRDIVPLSVSPLLYQSLDCDQLSAEMKRVHGRATELGARLDQAAQNDVLITTASVVLFLPALFFLGGTRQQEAEYARLKGEWDAIQQAAIARRCTLVLPAPVQTERPPASAVAEQPQ